MVWLLSPTKPPMWKMWIPPSQPQLHSKWRDLFWCFVSSSERAFSFLCCRTCLDISRTMFAMQFKSSREYGCKDVVFWVLESLIYIIQYQICLTNVYPIQYVWGLHLPWLLRWWYLYLWVTTLFPSVALSLSLSLGNHIIPRLLLTLLLRLHWVSRLWSPLMH